MIRKQVRHVSEQEESESRRLWKEVTYHLRTKNIEGATLAKHRIEQAQRDGVKQRKEANLKWHTRHFEERGENWVYVRPLTRRLAQLTSTNNSNNHHHQHHQHHTD